MPTTSQRRTGSGAQVPGDESLAPEKSADPVPAESHEAGVDENDASGLFGSGIPEDAGRCDL